MTYNPQLVRLSIQLAEQSVTNNNQPFGAILVDKDENVIFTSENTELTEDITGHAELNLIRKAYAIDKDILKDCIMYSSTEPCNMCTCGILNLLIKGIVFACSADCMSEIIRKGKKVQTNNPNYKKLSCEELVCMHKRPIEVIGPVLEDEAKIIHLSYWK